VGLCGTQAGREPPKTKQINIEVFDEMVNGGYVMGGEEFE
jgi:hypothetical protein